MIPAADPNDPTVRRLMAKALRHEWKGLQAQSALLERIDRGDTLGMSAEDLEWTRVALYEAALMHARSLVVFFFPHGLVRASGDRWKPSKRADDLFASNYMPDWERKVPVDVVADTLLVTFVDYVGKRIPHVTTHRSGSDDRFPDNEWRQVCARLEQLIAVFEKEIGTRVFTLTVPGSGPMSNNSPSSISFGVTPIEIVKKP